MMTSTTEIVAEDLQVVAALPKVRIQSREADD